MTPALDARRFVSWERVVAIAGVRLRRVMRTRLGLAALVLTLLPWLLVERATLLARLSYLAEFTVAGLTVLGAGAISDDIDSGEYAVALSHDCSPVDVIAGQALASLALTGALMLLQFPIAFGAITLSDVGPVLMSLGWLAAFLAGWLALMVLLATFVEGKGNAVAMIGVLVIVPLLLGPGLLDQLPPAIAEFVRNALLVLPQLDHATSMFRAEFSATRPPSVAPVVLSISPVFFFALASLRLYRLEPAGRLTQ